MGGADECERVQCEGVGWTGLMGGGGGGCQASSAAQRCGVDGKILHCSAVGSLPVGLAQALSRGEEESEDRGEAEVLRVSALRRIRLCQLCVLPSSHL